MKSYYQEAWRNLAIQLNRATEPLRVGLFSTGDRNAVFWKFNEGTESTNYQPHIRTGLSSDAINSFYLTQIVRFLKRHGLHAELKLHASGCTFLVLQDDGIANDHFRRAPNMTEEDVGQIRHALVHDLDNILSQRPDILRAVDILNTHVPLKGKKWQYKPSRDEPIGTAALVLPTDQDRLAVGAEIIDRLADAHLVAISKLDGQNNVVVSMGLDDSFDRVGIVRFPPLPSEAPQSKITVSSEASRPASGPRRIFLSLFAGKPR